MTIKVIGAGFGRTGTLSLKAALEELGFAKCYHMQEAYKNLGHIRHWKEISQGNPPHWEMLFRGYQATVDWPGCTYYRELMDYYPEAKIVLSVRDPEQWYESCRKTIYPARWLGPNWLVNLLPNFRHFPEMIANTVWGGTFHDRFEDKAYAIQRFNQHIEEVKRTVPPERLLVYDVKQGWEPLCHFLSVPVAHGKPFPHVNSAAQFQWWLRLRNTGIGLAYFSGFVLILSLIWLLLA